MLNKKNLIILLSFGILLRIFAIHYFGDPRVHHEWLKIINNLDEFKIFALRSIDGNLVETIFMPPLYPFILYFIKFTIIQDKYFFEIIFYFQLIISLASTFFLYKILKNFFQKKISLVGIFVFYFFPLNIYSISQISSVTLQVFLIIIFFYFLIEIQKKVSLKGIILFSSVSAALMLLRGEFFLIYLITLFFVFFKKKPKYIIFCLIISSTLVSPYLIRNYIVFDTIGITKSAGFNLWKGNNKNSTVEGSDVIYSNNLENQIKKIKSNSKYEIELDLIFKEEALRNIKSDPGRYVVLYINKVFSFLLFNPQSNYPNYYNILHILPKIIISLFCLAGMFLAVLKSRKLNYFIYYYFFNIFLFSIFFILPRYSLALLPIQTIFLCYFLENTKIKFFRLIPR